MSPTELPNELPTQAGELAGLAAEHRARWLAALLPDGPCAVVAGSAGLASALAANGRRAVVLVEARAARVEVASRVAAAGVRVVHGAIDEIALRQRSFASAVIVVSEAHKSVAAVASADRLVVENGSIAVVSPVATASRARAALEQCRRPVTSCEQQVRAASCIAVGEAPVIADTWAATSPAITDTVLLVSNASAAASALIGPDTGPAMLRACVEDLMRGVSAAHARARRAERDASRTAEVRNLLVEAEQTLATMPDIEATRAELVLLEAELAAANRRVDELVASNSWRATAPMRWVSDRLAHR